MTHFTGYLGARRQVPSQKTEIESMIAAGKPALYISNITGRSMDYINQIIGYYRRTASDNLPAADNDKHLALVFQGCAAGFPHYIMPAAYRVRA